LRKEIKTAYVGLIGQGAVSVNGGLRKV